MVKIESRDRFKICDEVIHSGQISLSHSVHAWVHHHLLFLSCYLLLLQRVQFWIWNEFHISFLVIVNHRCLFFRYSHGRSWVHARNNFFVCPIPEGQNLVFRTCIILSASQFPHCWLSAFRTTIAFIVKEFWFDWHNSKVCFTVFQNALFLSKTVEIGGGDSWPYPSFNSINCGRCWTILSLHIGISR